MNKLHALLWIIYLCLLGVLLPHTAWAFSQFEPSGALWVAWLAALFFEATIAALTYRLSQRISEKGRKKFAYRYLNPYALGLVISIAVSTAANLAHAVQFANDMRIVSEWNIPLGLYAFAFGAILPVSSLVFAWVLSTEDKSEIKDSDDLKAAKLEVTNIRRQLRTAEKRAETAELRYGAAGDILVKLVADEKKQRILAAKQLWPE